MHMRHCNTPYPAVPGTYTLDMHIFYGLSLMAIPRTALILGNANALNLSLFSAMDSSF